MDGRISNFMQVASLRRYTLTEGSGKGLDVLDCDNGNLRFLLNVSKACDIMQVYHKGQNVSFVSKNGHTKREVDFLNRFEGGMLYTCGLDSIGRRDGYPLHGTFHNIPAEIVTARCDECGILVEAIIRDTALFGKNLVLKRKISSDIGGDTLRLEDTLVNESFRDEEYGVLYHINVGYPMLDEGARIVVDEASFRPSSEWAKEQEKLRYEISAPVPNQDETCYYLKLNKPEVSLVNDKLGKKLTVAYSKDTLPYFLEWKSMASGDYAVGLEPTTTELDKSFAYKTVKAGEKVVFNINISVNDN